MVGTGIPSISDTDEMESPAGGPSRDTPEDYPAAGTDMHRFGVDGAPSPRLASCWTTPGGHMDLPWERRAASSEQVLTAVAEYLRLLEAEWGSLTDVQRRKAVRLALEAATAFREPGEAPEAKPLRQVSGECIGLACCPA